MANRAVLVTGASSGIGRAAALRFAEAGYDVAFSYRQQLDQAREVAGEITEKHGRRCAFFQSELHERGAAERLWQEALDAFAEFHVFFSNAGRTMYYGLQEEETEALDYLMNLNYRAPLILAQSVANHMVQKGIQGCILFNTSVRGRQAHPGDGVYGGLKAALERGARSFALDLAQNNIRVNCVAPGATVSMEREQSQPDRYAVLARRIPLRRLGRPEDIAEACVWLASDKATYITGQTLVIDGGLGLPGVPERPFDDQQNGWSEPSYKA